MEIRSTTEQDLGVFLDTVHAAFGRFVETPVNGGGLWWSALEIDRSLLAMTADGRPVGTAGAYSFELTLPGKILVPAPGVTAVGVLPSHRRQGVLTAMMRHQLTDLRARGEALSVLLASEASIYRRFGYGPATYTRKFTVPRNKAVLTVPRARATAERRSTASPDAASIELLRRAECGEILEEVYDRYRRAQPGALSRPHRWWASSAGRPPVNAAPRYVAVHRDAEDVPDGYASYSVADDYSTLTVDETIATDDAAFTALSRFALGHDLVKQIEFKHLPPDHSLLWQLADYAAGAESEEEWLWVRLLDVPRSLTTRGYFTDGELVLDVEDPFLGEHGRHLLTVRDGRAECVQTDREPDLSLDISDLGSIYLGGTTPSILVRAGHVRAHRPGAAAVADALFRAERAPHCLHWF